MIAGMGCLPRRGVLHPWLSFLLYTRGGTGRYPGRKESQGNIEITLMSISTVFKVILMIYKYGKILWE